jgi:tetratricopeptide (TPR) repeat protein
MAKKISIAAIITLIFVSFGCQPSYTEGGDVLAPRVSSTYYPGSFVSADASEIDIIELVEKYRTEYKQSLEALVDYYAKSGNNRKYNNAKNELHALNTMTQYDYFNVLIVQGIEPTTQIPDADLLYESAMLDKKNAEKIPAFPNKNLYRSALGKFKQLIKTYRKSDKVDDTAYEAGEILEALKDYPDALDFYTASYTWDPYTPYPARLRAARILDKYMHNYSEALTLYNQGLEAESKLEAKYYELFKNARERVAALEKTVEP